MKDPFDQSIIDWSVVNNWEKQKTLEAKALALAECDKILRYLLKDKAVKGQTLTDKINQIKTKISHLQDFLEAIEVKKRIFDDFEQEVSLPEIEKAIKAYRSAITDLAVEDLSESPTKNFKSEIIFFWHKKKKIISKSVLKIIFWLTLILLLDATHFGQKIIAFLADLIKSIFFNFWIWIVLFIIIIIVAIWLFFSQRKN